MGDRVPWHHLQGLHVVLVTIIPLAQTPQPFQFLSAQKSEYVTLFSFSKKLFCMKNSQQIRAISLKKKELGSDGQGNFGQAPCPGDGSSSAVLPADWWHWANWSATEQPPALAMMARCSRASPQNFMGQTLNPVFMLEMSYSQQQEGSPVPPPNEGDEFAERGKKNLLLTLPAKEMFHVKCSQPLNPVSAKPGLHALPVCLWSQLSQTLWEDASAQSRPRAVEDDY